MPAILRYDASNDGRAATVYLYRPQPISDVLGEAVLKFHDNAPRLTVYGRPFGDLQRPSKLGLDNIVARRGSGEGIEALDLLQCPVRQNLIDFATEECF